MKKKLLIIIPIILIAAAAIYYFCFCNENKQNDTYYKVEFYETYEAYCDCIDDCNCPSGPKLVFTAEVKDGDNAFKPEDLKQEGRTFVGWVLDDESNAELFDFNTPITKDTKLYSKWSNTQATTKTYEVKFFITYENYCNCIDCDCPSGPQLYKTVNVEEGSKVVKPDDPKQEGKTFAGWTTEEDGNNYFSFDTLITKDINLYSKWK